MDKNRPPSKTVPLAVDAALFPHPVLCIMKIPTLLLTLALGTTAAYPQAATQVSRNESLKQELRLGVERGLNFLRSKQNQETGQWGEA